MTVRQLLATFTTNLHLTFIIDGISYTEIPQNKIDRQVKSTSTDRDHIGGLVIKIRTV